MTRSIQSRLFTGTVLVAVVVLFGAAALLYHLVKSSLLREFDSSLTAKALLLSALVEQEDGKLEFEGRSAPEFRTGASCEYFEIGSLEGQSLESSPSLAGRHLSHLRGGGESPVCHDTALPDGRPGRQVELTFHPHWADEGEGSQDKVPQQSRAVTLQLARSTQELRRTLAHLRFLLIGIGSLATILLVGLLAAAVRKGLRPLHALAVKISQLGEADLSTRVELSGAPAELLPVVDRLNELLLRLEAAFAREKAFSADIAHELRTPLAGLRSTLEVALTRPREGDAYRATLASSLSITCQMQQMTDTLLALARAESGQVGIAAEPVDMEALLRQSWAAVAAAAETRHLRVTWDLQACRIESDIEKLRQLMTNVLDNAVTYADSGGQIRIQCSGAGGMARLSVSNTGCTLTPEQMPHVFERFWRSDASRLHTGLHSGLGLALCRKLIGLLGGEIEAECDHALFKITISLPVRRSARA